MRAHSRTSIVSRPLVKGNEGWWERSVLVYAQWPGIVIGASDLRAENRRVSGSSPDRCIHRKLTPKPNKVLVLTLRRTSIPFGEGWGWRVQPVPMSNLARKKASLLISWFFARYLSRRFPIPRAFPFYLNAWKIATKRQSRVFPLFGCLGVVLKYRVTRIALWRLYYKCL